MKSKQELISQAADQALIAWRNGKELREAVNDAVNANKGDKILHAEVWLEFQRRKHTYTRKVHNANI
jgi:hypothetical protein